MKRIIIILVIGLIFHSCSNFNYSNFNKQKFTTLKVKSSKNVQTNKDDHKSKKADVVAFKPKQKKKKNQIVKNESNLSADYKVKNKQNINKELTQKTNTVTNIKNTKQVKNSRKKEKINSIENNKINGLFFFLILLLSPIMFVKSFGYNVAKWAKNNVKKAQALIALFTITGLISSFALGNILNFHVSKLMLVISTIFGVSSFLLYQIKLKKQFVKNKLAISMFSTSGLFMSFSAGSNSNYHLLQFSNEMAINPVLAVLLSILIIALLVLSIYGLAALACGISCVGYEVLGSVVFIGGTIGFLFLAIWAIFNLFRKKDQPKYENENEHEHEHANENEKRKADINTILLVVLIVLIALLLFSLILVF